MENQFELSEVLKHLAEQLSAADAAARVGGNPVMQFEDCELEFAVKLETGAKGGVKVWVMEFGGEKKREQSNRVKVRFKAISGKVLQAPQVSADTPANPATRQPTQKRV